MKYTKKELKQKRLFLRELSENFSDMIDDAYDAGVKRAIDEALKHIDKYIAEVNDLKTGRSGEIDFMKKDGILAGLSMARFFVERLKEEEQE